MKRRQRKPETILRKVREAVNDAHRWLNTDRGTGNHWVEENQALLRALSRISELRAALKARP